METRENLPKFVTNYSELSEVTYRWEIGWLESGAGDSTKSIHQLNSTVLGLTADSSVTNDDLVKQLIVALSNLTGNDSSGAHSVIHLMTIMLYNY